MTDPMQFPSELDAIIEQGSAGVILPWADTSLLLRVDTAPVPKGRRRVSVFRRPDEVRYATDRREAVGDTFISLCYAHGETLFDTTRGGCLLCEASVASSGLPAHRVAELIGADRYDDECEDHGAALFNTRTGRCAECSAGNVGAPVQDDNARANARRAGRTTYEEVCSDHGMTEHSVLRGKCLQCYNSAGHRRPKS